MGQRFPLHDGRSLGDGIVKIREEICRRCELCLKLQRSLWRAARALIAPALCSHLSSAHFFLGPPPPRPLAFPSPSHCSSDVAALTASWIPTQRGEGRHSSCLPRHLICGWQPADRMECCCWWWAWLDRVKAAG